jgi:cellulose synthase/poly-beta-1,6-N-acetylglucosamine synthase-like glycosyltransferase
MGGVEWAVVGSGVFAVFVGTQVAYFLVNTLAIALLYTRPEHVVPEASPTEYPRLHVLLPVYREPRAIVEATLENVYASEYPRENLSVFLIHEADDTHVKGYLAALRREAHRNGLEFQAIEVDRDLFAVDTPGASWLNTGGPDPVPRTKAAALRYAFRTGAFHPDDVVTVFDADTRVPPDLFELGIRGLEDYDVVQAKQTVRNRDAGWLPRLEAMGIAAWSHVVYPRTAGGPYQLLGKGYFATVDTLHDLDDWQPASITEDMRLGLDASARGYSLGVVDRYVQDLCPAAPGDWVRQKTRWVAGPYRTSHDGSLSRVDSLRFLFYAVLNQSLSLVNVLGVPAGLVVLALTLAGSAPAFPWWLRAVVTVNLLVWAYYSVRSYAAASDAIAFDSRRERFGYFLVSNPITQALYATVWAVPILNLASHVLRRSPVGFSVTAKSE